MKRLTKSITTVGILALLALCLNPALAQADTTLAEDTPAPTGQQVNPQKINDIWYLPLKSVASSQGFEVKWNQADKKVEVKKDAQWTSLRIGANSYFFARMAPVALSGPPVLEKGVTWVPAEFMTHILKLNLEIRDDKYFISQEMSAQHSGYIQKIEAGSQSQMVYIAPTPTTDKLEEMTILHVYSNSLVQTPLTVGKEITAHCPPIMALSLPGQTSAYIVYTPGAAQ